ncbi:MAG TPA: VOC family protein [Solirubrobacteraceae bacterium]|nr:VOC family protein [Solirubrobacteraceae bacterium]
MHDGRDHQPGGLVHLELHTSDLSGASTFYDRLLGWRTERLDSRWGTYHGLALGDAIGGGIVECAARRPLWLPYVQVEDVEAVTERGRALGAAMLLEPREGPAGWRSVLASSEGGEIALWQPKRVLARRIG